MPRPHHRGVNVPYLSLDCPPNVTNVLSEARRGSPEAPDWLRSVDPADLYLSDVTLGEIMKGIVAKAGGDARMASSRISAISVSRC